MRECDGGTAWDRVEHKSYPLSSPYQSIQVSWIVVCQLQRGDCLISPTLIKDIEDIWMCFFNHLKS